MRYIIAFFWSNLLAFLWGVNLVVAAGQQFSAHNAGFSIKVKGVENPYTIMTVYALPADKLEIKVKTNSSLSAYRLYSPEGKVIPAASRHWQWRAPAKPGRYQLKIVNGDHTQTMSLNVFVMVPFDQIQGEYLNGYRVGRYPLTALKGLAIYKPPPGFVEVTSQNEDTLVSPHFKLKQFLCKQNSGYPQYLALQEKLLLKLELILARVNQHGYRCDTLHVMSGYRTPYYNKAIGNVKYSRHIYGGAADIFIDENPKDGLMDDINRDGKVDYKDAAVLYRIVDGLYGKRFYDSFLGGLARYRRTSDHGPFVHVDVRGRRARWGD